MMNAMPMNPSMPMSPMPGMMRNPVMMMGMPMMNPGQGMMMPMACRVSLETPRRIARSPRLAV